MKTATHKQSQLKSRPFTGKEPAKCFRCFVSGETISTNLHEIISDNRVIVYACDRHLKITLETTQKR